MLHAVLETLAILYGAPILLNLAFYLVARRPLPLPDTESRASLVPPPSDPTARVHILFARGRAFRMLFGGHSYILYKQQGAPDYVRIDWDQRGEPIRTEGWQVFEPGFAGLSGFQYAADGWHAEQLIPAIEASIAAYASRHVHDYHRSPGPNSNTFVQGVIDGVPFLDAVLTPLAVGKDYPHDGRIIRRLHSGILISLGGWLALRVGWIEGLELSILCQVVGIDWRRPAIKLPSIGRVGLPVTPLPRAGSGAGRVMLPEQRQQMESRKAQRGARLRGGGPAMGAARPTRGFVRRR